MFSLRVIYCLLTATLIDNRKANRIIKGHMTGLLQVKTQTIIRKEEGHASSHGFWPYFTVKGNYGVRSSVNQSPAKNRFFYICDFTRFALNWFLVIALLNYFRVKNLENQSGLQRCQLKQLIYYKNKNIYSLYR